MEPNKVIPQQLLNPSWLTAQALILGLCMFLSACGNDQGATITESEETIKTYPFGDPDPVPILTGRSHIYPYFSFSQYSHDATDEDWKVIRLENEYIEVSMLPEIGGKIWGASEKSTGKEFIYHNEVNKFRNIALRGPWTSGGIEFNFGIIGHTPATATPVDYITRENDDGSVSTIVGGLDLPSRTEWRVNVTLPKDKAYFETESFSYNPTNLEQSNYIWMNAAIRADDDLQFFYPGQYHIGHPGDAHPWPINEEGRDASFYRNNDFGGSKSYHIMGEIDEYFGAYWQDQDFGFGNWSIYSDMPGKKLWIWSLSRAGGIYEDLLTDNDGQYVEVQSGRLFSQAQGRTVHTPFNHNSVEPAITDRWKELWFPVKDTDGISAASPYGVLHVQESEGRTIVKLMALQAFDEDLNITSGEDLISNNSISLEPMELYHDTLAVSGNQNNLNIVLGDQKLVYNSERNLESFDRPLENDLPTENLSAAQTYRLARNQAANRDYTGAMETYYASLEIDPTFTASYVGLADLYYRRGEYDQALEYAKEAVSHNTYEPDANHIYGVIQARLGNTTQALEAYGWAARSMRYRSGDYASMAEIYIKKGNHARALEFANRSVDFNNQNINAYKVLAISHRKQQNSEEAQAALNRILELDPLNHFARFEQYQLEQSDSRLNEFTSLIRGELPHETYLELAIYYANQGFEQEAVEVLTQAPSTPMVNYWLAFLHRNTDQDSSQYLDQAIAESPHLIFPFRLESIPVLQWAQEQNSSWKNNYYLSLIYWNAGREADAGQLLTSVGDEPDYAPFYLARGELSKDLNYSSNSIYSDFQRANELNPDEWRTWHALNNYYFDEDINEAVLETSEQAYEMFPEKDAIAMDYAHALLVNQQYGPAADHLNEIRILPFYQSGAARSIYEQANTFHALELIDDGEFDSALEYLNRAKTSPENLAAGEPYNPDIRLQNYLIAMVHQQVGNQDQAEEHLNDVVNYTREHPNRGGSGQYVGVLAMRNMGQENEARQYLDSLRNGRSDLISQWAVANFNQDQQTSNQLAQENTDNLSFRMFVESINSINRL